MIDWIEIRHFAVAEGVELEFENNFTVVTGETGSGKSIIVDAIGILMGHRSDSSYIMHNQDSAEIQAGFTLSADHPALHWLVQQGMDNDGECILRRTLRRGKPGRGYINGRAATVTQLRSIGKELADIHGQNEHHSLLKRSVQTGLLDNAAGIESKITELGKHYETIRDIQSEIEELDQQSQATQERADLLKFQIEELRELGPKTGEWEQLESQQKRLSHQQELTTGAQDIAQTLYHSDDDNIDSKLILCNQQLTQLAQFDDNLKNLAEMVDEARVILEETAHQLQPYFQDNEIDEHEIMKIENRFSQFHSLARKHRVQPQLLAEHLESMESQLEKLRDPKAELACLNQSLDEETDKFNEVAGSVSKNREKHGRRLSREVTALMQNLGMKGGEFRIQLESGESGKITRYGSETVEFLVTANAGQPLQALAKVASGGELSRISLAIQVILANKAQVPTLIFDEVDVGIGGEIANVVGERLRELGKSRQVLCVTHLSQVAAKGVHHLSVSKASGKQLQLNVSALDQKQRIEEIARMTAGERITKQSLAHAEEMLKSA